MGKKYLLEIEENKDGGFAWSNFAPYTAPDLEQVKKEAYDDGYSDGYDAGLDDAWKAARKIADMPYKDGEKIFGVSGWHIIEKRTVDEVIAEIKALEESEESKKEQSVTAEDVMRQYLNEFCKSHSCSKDCVLNTDDFTCGRGNHFTTDSPVSNEEVRRAYAKVVKEK